MSALKQELEQAVVQLRATDAALGKSIAALEDAGVWSGDDARKFQTAWSEQVHRNITIATATLEALSFVPAG